MGAVDTTLTIGQVAKRAGIGVEAVRFYERRGLIDRPHKPATGFRRYPPEVVARIEFIRRASAAGFTLRDVGELLALRARPAAPCAGVRSRAVSKVADIDRRLDELQRIRSALVTLVEACKGDCAIAACSILTALDGTTDPNTAMTGETSCKTTNPPLQKTRASRASKRASAASRTA